MRVIKSQILFFQPDLRPYFAPGCSSESSGNRHEANNNHEHRLLPKPRPFLYSCLYEGILKREPSPFYSTGECMNAFFIGAGGTILGTVTAFLLTATTFPGDDGWKVIPSHAHFNLAVTHL